jgi:hypothetical protein
LTKSARFISFRSTAAHEREGLSRPIFNPPLDPVKSLLEALPGALHICDDPALLGSESALPGELDIGIDVMPGGENGLEH